MTRVNDTREMTMEEVNEQAVVEEAAAVTDETFRDAAAAQALVDAQAEADAQAARDEEVAAAQAEADQARVDAEQAAADAANDEVAVEAIVEDDEDTSDVTGVHGSVPPTVGLPSDGDGE